MLIWFLCFEYQGHFHGTYVLFVAFFYGKVWQGLVTFAEVMACITIKLDKCLWN